MCNVTQRRQLWITSNTALFHLGFDNDFILKSFAKLAEAGAATGYLHEPLSIQLVSKKYISLAIKLCKPNMHIEQDTK